MIKVFSTTLSSLANYSGIFNVSGFRSNIEELNVMGLADRGYSHQLLIRPDDKMRASRLRLTADEYSAQQARFRAPGEIVFSTTKLFTYADQRASDNPEIQAFCLMIIYFLVKCSLSDRI